MLFDDVVAPALGIMPRSADNVSVNSAVQPGIKSGCSSCNVIMMLSSRRGP